MKRKAIQITVIGTKEAFAPVALCNDGTMWCHGPAPSTN